MTAHFTMPEPDHAGEFRSKLVAGNGEIVTASEGYTRVEDAYQWSSNLLRWVVEADENRVRVLLTETLAPYFERGGELSIPGLDAAVDSCVAALKF